MTQSTKIPKVIHYCWFGGNPLPDKAKKCIESWRKYLPGYEIKEWNESNFDVHCCPFVHEAYMLKKWAFVSDYARFWIMYHHGGLYFDTDVELLRDFEPIVSAGPFMGCEPEWDVLGLRIAAGLGLGAYPKMKVYYDFLNIYEQMHLIQPSGTLKLPTVVDIVTEYFLKKGARQSSEVIRCEEILVYPPEYFCPMNYGSRQVNITSNTYSIHLYEGSWLKRHWLETFEEPFWKLFHHVNHQVLWRLRNMLYRWSFHLYKTL
ncbi:MAG: glycosyltransferase [Bacteroidales bacterium]|nr:glycosyltransferase [Bacteroidales bacterium]